MLGKRLKDLRGNRTQEDVAKIIGISRARYSHYENGRSEPDTDTLQKIADFYQVSIDWLLTGRESMVPRMIVTQNLPRIRERYNLSHEEIAQLANVDSHTVQKWETGDKTPSNTQLKQINEYLSNNYLEYAHAYIDGVHGTGVPVLSMESPKFSNDELKIIEEIKKHPVLFHDLANAPEKKIKQLIKMWEFINKDLDDDEDESIIDD